MKRKLLFFSIFLYTLTSIKAQTSNVIITVDWPQWSTENKVELYNANGTLATGDDTLITPIIDNGYDGSGAAANPYNTSETYSDLTNNANSPEGTGYYVIVYDTYGDGWNGNGSMSITVDGVSVLNFDGSFSTSGTNVEITETLNFAVEDPIPLAPGVSEFDGSGNNYIEYIHGNLPIIISAPHGGTITSGSLPNRTCGTDEPDDNTGILIRAIQDEIFAQTGGYAHVIINNLNRIKLDPNREVDESTCYGTNTNNTDETDTTEALYYWNAWHKFIDDASTVVEANYEKGLYIDLHGQSHTTPRIEIGYRVSRNDLLNNNLTSANSNYNNIVSGSSINNLVSNNLGGLDLEELVRGPNSLGALFHNAPGTYYASQNYPNCSRNGTNGYRATPSNFNGGAGECNDTAPNNSNYFSGFYYNNERHGSANITVDDGSNPGGTGSNITSSGNIDGIMTEVNRRVRDVGSTLEPFAIDYANVVLNYIDIHYNDFTIFNYGAATYDITDTDPSPTIDGVSNGIFTSTIGLTIDTNTGEIDASNSLVGAYTITYSFGPTSTTYPNGYYSTTRNVEITDNTLSTETIEREYLLFVYPNPTEDYIYFKASKKISEVLIYNTIGQIIGKHIFNKTIGKIDVSSLHTGLYIVQFLDDNKSKVLTKQIVKK
ncbi:T9SS type A sorting domain-containing protein [Lacinutrix sp. WUR7]|uniref:T9SS type A sorting domain-containing protein n=1 Tax=Lacinutrix sp. WUR7 TaxID=2653681 RepID=UPI001EEF91DA|nr:T9SS type A sorting domain-containing protein [Lacinutrix sp. WUR7]